MDAIVADGVGRQYGETVALDDVSLSVAEGELFGLVGPNGAGKTTLVRALTATTDSSGTVELFGRPPRELDRERLGLLPQNFAPPDRLTARELVDFYSGLYEHARPPDELLAEVGVADSAHTHYEKLSGGQQRRVCVATALVNDPDLLVLDEPTTGIDPAGRRTLWDLLDTLADAGTSILLTTHYMAEAEYLADRVGLLADGRLVAVDSPDALVERHGGESLLSVEGTFPPETADLLDHDATATDGELTVRDVAPEEIGAVTETLNENGVGYESLTWREPDLEDVYLDLVENEFGTETMHNGHSTGHVAVTAGANRTDESGGRGAATDGSVGGGSE
jgi:ABC-2 type transport system ATP-binding protein